MTWHRRVALATLVFGVGLGCGGGAGGSGGPGGGDAGTGGGGSGSGNITANVDGQAWQSTVASEQAQVGPLGAITIQGTYANTTTITLNLYNIDQPGTYPLGVGAAVVGGLGLVSTASGMSWATPSSGAAGSVTLTTLTSTRIAGTFTFDATPLIGGATGNKAVTNGNFDLILASNGNFGTLPDNQGSVVRGSVAGAPWNAATAFMTLPGGTLSLSFGNLTYTIGVLKTSFTGPGTYEVGLSPGLAAVSAVVPSTGLGPSWVPAVSGSGTFTVTSLTATRIQGTLSATLVPLAGSGATGNLDISNLAIDIGRN